MNTSSGDEADDERVPRPWGLRLRVRFPLSDTAVPA